MISLSIITLGHVHTDALTALSPYFSKLEQLVLDVHPRSVLADKRAELNRAVDAGSSDWLLIVREPETIDDALAKEIAAAVTDAKAWGFRIRTQPLYRGKALQLGDRAGEVRLFHRRHFLRRGEPAVQGTVIRLANALQAITFESADAHREHLAKEAAPHSLLRRVLLFLRDVAGSRTLDANTLRYIWIEAGFDR